jgi:hypothetical protein
MRVYIVIASLRYEGDNIERVFANLDSAQPYADRLNASLRPNDRSVHYYVDDWVVDEGPTLPITLGR